MELKAKFKVFNKYIADENNNSIFKVKYAGLFSREKKIYNLDNRLIYSVKYAADSKNEFAFIDHRTNKKIYGAIGDKISINNFLCPKEFNIENENICVRCVGVNKYDVIVNGNKDGIISRKGIISNSIKDKGILAMLYVFSSYIINYDEILMASNLMQSYV